MYFSIPVRVVRASCLVSRRLVSYLDTPRLGSWSNVTCQAYPREDDRYSRQAPRELRLLEFSYHRKRILNSLSPRSLMCCIQRNRQHHYHGLVRAAHLRSQFSGCFHAKFSHPHDIIIVASSFEAPNSKPTACPSLFSTCSACFSRNSMDFWKATRRFHNVASPDSYAL